MQWQGLLFSSFSPDLYNQKYTHYKMSNLLYIINLPKKYSEIFVYKRFFILLRMIFSKECVKE